jgi:hypothetical protein
MNARCNGTEQPKFSASAKASASLQPATAIR